jgi:micrococcal nuclease
VGLFFTQLYFIGELLMRMLLFVLLLIPFMAFAETKTPDFKVYDFEVTRVIDGDTVAFSAPFLPEPLKKELSIRVFGVDTPEKSWRGQCDQERKLGEIASQFTKKALKEADKIQVAIMDWDKYGGRVLGDILLDGKSLRKMLIEKGYARPYFGEKKTSWCE